MPKWVADHAKWKEAKKQARKSNPKDFYAVVTTIYKNMGGKIKKKKQSKGYMNAMKKALLSRG